jgi:hypothetical protein
MNFRVGQKVVCVDDDPGDDDGTFPTAGAIYTVSWIGVHVCLWEGPELCVRLAEIIRPKNSDGDVVPYRASRFRPAVDIQQFRDLVAPIFAGKKVSA